ncbi:MAG: exodeoxyribonuclease V subunit gamma [Ignavibacteria bacterium]|nr:exodeoxyribonuclease V subunit gamma [Ignavibacteria bacterium]
MYLYSKKISQEINPFEEVQRRIREGKFSSFIYVVPTRRKVRYLIRELIELAPNKATPKLNLFTIGDLAEEIFKSRFSNYQKISSSLQYFLIKKILSEGDFKFFSTKGKYVSNGLVDLIIAVITRLKELGISNQNFEKELDQLEGYNRIKAEDISLIYNEYQSLLIELKLYEVGDVYLSINQLKQEEIESAFRNVFPDADYLLITGFNEFTKPELKLIEALSKINSIEMVLTLDFNHRNEEVFGNLFDTHNHLLGIGFNYLETNQFEKNGEFHQIIKEHLFNSTSEKKIPAKNVFKFSGFDARDEIETIAKIIKLKIQQNPSLQLNQICVAIKGIKDYSNLIREIFYKYGIPVNVTDRFYLKNSSPIISIVRLLDLIKNDYFYEDLFYVLRSSYFDFSGIDIANLREALEIIKITQGKERILNAIEKRIGYLQQLSDEEAPFKQKEINKLEKAKEDFYKLIELLEPLGKNQTAQSFVEKLSEIIAKLRVYEKIFEVKLPIENDINLVTYSKDVRSLNLFEGILEELIYTFEKLNIHTQSLPFERFYDFITSAIFGTRYNIKERWGYGVLVTSPDEIRGLSFSILFLPGLENGVFPSRYTPLIFLEEKFVRNEKQKLLEDRYLFYQCLNAFENELYLSYPKQDEKKEKIVSDFLVELEKICELNEFDKSQLETFVFSESELFERFSLNELLDFKFESQEIVTKIFKVNETIQRIQKRIENKIDDDGKEYCGIITDEKLLQELYTNFGNKPFSITELETYAQCPFKYFINYIIQPKVEEEIEEDIQRNEFGIIIHQILYRFLNKLKNENRNFYDELKTNRDNLSLELKSIAKDIISIYERLNPFFFLTEEIILGSEKIPSILDKFLELEYERVEDSFNYIPSEFEKSIEASQQTEDLEFVLKGKIDRIDVNEENSTFKVIDYKTGEPPSKKDYDEKISFQLPLYLTLVEKYFQSINKDLKIDDAEFVKLSPKKKDGVKINSFREMYVKNSDLSTELNSTLKTIAELVKKIKSGKFNLTTIEGYETKICRKCGYQSICRIDVIKSDAINEETTS